MFETTNHLIVTPETIRGNAERPHMAMSSRTLENDGPMDIQLRLTSRVCVCVSSSFSMLPHRWL